MKNKCLLLLLFASFPIFSWADETLDSLLHVLDQTILAHDTYVVQRESRIRHLKELAGDVAPNSIERYNLNNQIYKEYKAFICDSAIYYLNENVRIAGNLGDTDREIESKLQLSLLLSSTGMYTESIDVLKSVDRQKDNKKFYWGSSPLLVCIGSLHIFKRVEKDADCPFMECMAWRSFKNLFRKRV